MPGGWGIGRDIASLRVDSDEILVRTYVGVGNFKWSNEQRDTFFSRYSHQHPVSRSSVRRSPIQTDHSRSESHFPPPSPARPVEIRRPAPYYMPQARSRKKPHGERKRDKAVSSKVNHISQATPNNTPRRCASAAMYVTASLQLLPSPLLWVGRYLAVSVSPRKRHTHLQLSRKRGVRRGFEVSRTVGRAKGQVAGWPAGWLTDYPGRSIPYPDCSR